MELAELIQAAIADSATLINATAHRWPDRPIQIELSWHPSMGKLDRVIRTVDHLPSWRPKTAASGESSD